MGFHKLGILLMGPRKTLAPDACLLQLPKMLAVADIATKLGFGPHSTCFLSSHPVIGCRTGVEPALEL